MIYYYVEGKRIDEILFLCKKLNLHIITTNEAVHECSINSGVKSTAINKEPYKFKSEIRRLKPSAVILNNDHLSAHGQWIARNYKTYVFFDLTINTRNRLIARSNTGFIGSKLFKVMHKVGGFSGLLYNVDINLHNCSIKIFLRLLRDRLFLNYKPHTALPGWYCNKVIVQSDEIKKLYLENDFSKEKVINIGVHSEDYYLEKCTNHNNIEPSIDVLLFSQPFYLRGFDSWIDEVGDLVNDCYNNGLNLVIKLHPGDIVEKYDKFKNKCEIIFSDGSSTTIIDLIQRSKLVVIKHSTVIIQSLLCKKPIAFINYRNMKPYVDNRQNFLDIMILNQENNIKSIYDNIHLAHDLIMTHQEEKLRKIARFDHGSISRFANLLKEDGLI